MKVYLLKLEDINEYRTEEFIYRNFEKAKEAMEKAVTNVKNRPVWINSDYEVYEYYRSKDFVSVASKLKEELIEKFDCDEDIDVFYKAYITEKELL